MRPLVIGYGSPLRGDDGVGWRVIDALEQAKSNLEVTSIGIHQLVPELAEPISRASLVVFVDATENGIPGEVQVVPLEMAQPSRGTHQTTPEGLLTLANDLYGRKPPAYVVTISGEVFGLSEELSVVVAAAVPNAVGQVFALINEISADLPDQTDSGLSAE